MNLKDFLKLAGQEGKVVVVGEDGEVRGVFLPLAEYQKLAGEQTEKPAENLVEKANREILQAQLEEVISSVDGGTASSQFTAEALSQNLPAERIDALLNRRAQELFKSVPNYHYTPPEVTSLADEEIAPNFDDI
jgi:hypothetical protein